MKIKEFDHDTEHGFAWIEVEPPVPGDDLIVQCCLHSEDYGETEPPTYLPRIVKSDCGHDWGMCGDANEAAFAYYGENRCMTALFAHAEANGLEVVD